MVGLVSGLSNRGDSSPWRSGRLTRDMDLLREDSSFLRGAPVWLLVLWSGKERSCEFVAGWRGIYGLGIV